MIYKRNKNVKTGLLKKMLLNVNENVLTLINSKLTNDSNNNVTINTAETITSTERCGPLRYNTKFYNVRHETFKSNF